MKRMMKPVLLVAMLFALAWSAGATEQSGQDEQPGRSAGQAGQQSPMLDQNRDGRISAKEHAAAAEAMFQRMDADRDGNLTTSELERGRATTTGAGSQGAMGPGKMGHGMMGHGMTGHGMSPGMMDRDGDGAISAEEHAAMAQAMFQRMDTDRDGRITASEMGPRRGTMMGGGMRGARQGMDMTSAGIHVGMSPADRLEMMDLDGDGRISAVEHAAGMQALFDEADTDNDGSLSMAERAAHHATMMRRMMEAGQGANEGG